ncbi:TA system toxin CbtA family protein [Escherichia coli]|uniref:TA system toxin CbtA family protein n=1 Tax=Escherichia coli TaxID=562 RepID=UPI0017509964|nr:TA system toxin CbtA family protein [Escherichia coli]HAG7624704.1 toxin CbtA [Escherichia coli]HAM9378752.1 toxin CbtA [Escherichia coli]HAM9702718.1 toxin CbtA [Escherichia coli]HCU5366255.1 toxin CbtA [Escherichia coli]HDV9593284.1 toxin CbtA [Escherichia coli]
MQISTAPATVPVSSRPSPIEIWQILLEYLLTQHYGLTLNDTPFSDESTIRDHINAGISLSNAVNFIVEKYELVRTDRNGFTIMEQSPFISSIDILRARQATGLMKRQGYKFISNITTDHLRQERHL